MQRDYIGYVLAIICLIIGIIVSWHYYEKSRQFRAPALVQDFFPYTIFDLGEEFAVPLKVLKSDGSPLSKSVHVARHIFWNYGTQPITGADVLMPIKVSMGIGSEILAVSISEESRHVVSCEVKQENDHDFLINFRILESEDGCAIKVFYSGNKYPKYNISGEIIGVKKIELISKTLDDLYKAHEERQKYNVIPNLSEAPAAIGFLAFGVSFIFYMRTKELPKRKFYLHTILSIVLVGLVIYVSEIIATEITSISYRTSDFSLDTSTWVSRTRPVEEWPMLENK